MVVMDTYQGRVCAQREYRVAEAKQGLSGPTLQTQAKVSSSSCEGKGTNTIHLVLGVVGD